MPAKSLSFKRLRFTNPYKRIRSNFRRDAADLPKAEAAFIRRRAISLMKKGPNRPRTLYGQLKSYKQRHRRTGRYFYWQKGIYSRPGHPPFHYGKPFDLRKIFFDQISASDVGIPTSSYRGGHVNAWRVGPRLFNGPKRGRRSAIPIPQLHEYGGTVQLGSRKSKTFKTRVKSVRLRRREEGTAKYPARPYMRPAAEEGRRSARAKKGGSIPRLTKMGGMKGKRIY